MGGYILLCDSKERAFSLSREIYVDYAVRAGKPIEPPPTNMFGICENILSGQFGLLAKPGQYWDQLPEKYREPRVHATPLWVDERFISGEPFSFIGGSPFGFGVGTIEPTAARKILEGNFAPKLMQEVKNSTRKYTFEVQTRAEQFIREASVDSAAMERLLTTIDPFLFEEVVAELLAAKGFDVHLTSRTRDRGKDIYAVWPDATGPLLMMVECKRLKPDSALDAINIRALLGQFTFEREHGSLANCAMLATTAKRLGTVATEFSETVSEISVKGFEELCQWIRQYGQHKNGLWLPKTFDQVVF
ncbi:MAG: hypothetical protein C0483_10875 [Pirellula sp.]|nr:hypothetical protein [Pirellula sp.]